jgi:hypothetical protein
VGVASLAAWLSSGPRHCRLGKVPVHLGGSVSYLGDCFPQIEGSVSLLVYWVFLRGESLPDLGDDVSYLGDSVSPLETLVSQMGKSLPNLGDRDFHLGETFPNLDFSLTQMIQPRSIVLWHFACMRQGF